MFINKKQHTPLGVNDVLERECRLKKQVQEKINSIFSSYGYFEVETPCYEFAEVFGKEMGREMIKFIDSDGSVVALRSDMTMPIARMVSSGKGNMCMPRRICYFANSYRRSGVYNGILQNEFTQAGVELIGASNACSDAEVIALTIESLLECGVNDFKIELGHFQYLNGILSAANLDEDISSKIASFVRAKNMVAVSELANSYINDSHIKDGILNLLNQFGDYEILARQPKYSSHSSMALENIAEIYNILSDYGYEKYVSIDLGLSSDFEYYTGVLVKGFARGIGFPVCGGGRYDSLIKSFGGTGIPATGIAIGVDRLLQSLNLDLPPVSADTVICFEDDILARKSAIKLSAILRKSGLRVQMWHNVCDFESAKKYAQNSGVCTVINVLNKDDTEIYNTADETISHYSVSYFYHEEW